MPRETLTGLNATITSKNSEIAGLNATITSKDSEITGLNATITSKDSEITGLNATIKEKISELEKYSTKKFAQAFETEKNEYNVKLIFWAKTSIWAFIILLILTIIITTISWFSDSEISKRLTLFFMESIAVVFTYFSVQQYTYYTNNYSKSLEKQTLAQGYHNILISEQDGLIKDDYKTKLVDKLCSTPQIINEGNFLFEKALGIIESMSKGIIDKLKI